jgi:hypothetical protein
MRRAITALAMACLVTVPALAGELAAAQRTALDSATYVYIQSERKSGEMGKPAEIWFMHVGDDVYVGTRPTSHRVKRIKAGHTRAHIAIGSVDGPSYDARGSISTDDAMKKRMLAEYAKKYPDGWKQHAEGFEKGFENGERVLVKYAPL